MDGPTPVKTLQNIFAIVLSLIVKQLGRGLRPTLRWVAFLYLIPELFWCINVIPITFLPTLSSFFQQIISLIYFYFYFMSYPKAITAFYFLLFQRGMPVYNSCQDLFEWVPTRLYVVFINWGLPGELMQVGLKFINIIVSPSSDIYLSWLEFKTSFF